MRNIAAGRQVVAGLAHRFLGEQERLEPDAGRRADQRQRVGQGVDDEVVLLVRAVEERPAVVDVDGHPRIRVDVLGVEVAADLGELRVDLDRVDVLRAPGQGERGVGARCRRR